MLSQFRSILGLVQALCRRRSLENRLQEELQLHIELLAEKNMREGMSHKEAQRRAHIAVGGLDQTRETVSDARGIRWIADVPRNFRHSFRRMAGAPLVSLVVILSLGLGIGANTAIFSVIHHVLLRSLPVDKPEELALVVGLATRHSVGTSMSGNQDYVFSYEVFREMERRQQRTIAELAGFRYLDGNIAYNNDAQSGRILTVSGDYFSVMRVRPFIGRPLASADDQGAGNPVAMLGYDFWKNHLGAQAGVLNQPIRLFGRIFTIVGVTPKGFFGTTTGTPPDVIIPLASFMSLPIHPLGADLNSSMHSWLYEVARIAPETTREQAAAYYAPIYSAIAREAYKNKSGIFHSLNDLSSDEMKKREKTPLKFVDGSRGYSTLQEMGKPSLLILMIATGLVLAIAMANAANLLLARSAARRRELAICAAIGASRGKIIGQLLSEAMALSLAGCIAGITFSYLTLNFLSFLLSQLMSAAPIVMSFDLVPTRLEWPVLLYGFGLALLTGFVFGLYPALEAARVAPMAVLNQESGHSSQTLGSAKVRKTLVCAQVMLSVLLLIPTGLFLKSLVNLTNVDLGLKTNNKIVFSLSPAANGYSPRQSKALFERTEQSLAAIPGVTGVTSAIMKLIGNSINETAISVQGQQIRSHWNEIGPGFFSQMGIPLLSGREFTERDNQTGQNVAIINEQFANKLFAGKNPIGLRLYNKCEIVGVVKDAHYESAKQPPPKTYYLPWRQNAGSSMLGAMTFYVRSGLPPEEIMAQIRKTMQTVDYNLPIEGLQPMETQVNQSLSPDRLMFQLAGILATLATVLAVIGLYGVMAYSVVRRTHEIGIRMAIGAKPAGIRQMVLREMLMILAIGLILGTAAALLASKAIESALFGVKSYDPLVVAGASLTLGLAAFAAAYLPAWRASRIDPLNALRQE